MSETASLHPRNLSTPLLSYGESEKAIPQVVREVAEHQAQMSPRVALDLVHDNPELFSVQSQTAPDLTPNQQDQLEAKTQRYENQPEIFDGAHRIAEVVARASDETAESRAKLADAEARMSFSAVLGKPDAASAEAAVVSREHISGIERHAKYDIKAIEADIADRAHQRVHDMFGESNDNLSDFWRESETPAYRYPKDIVVSVVAPRPAPEPVIEPVAEPTGRIPRHLQERARAAMNRAGAPENSEPAKAAEEPQPQIPEPLFPNRPSSLDWSADLPSDAADVYEASSFNPPEVGLDQPIAADPSEPVTPQAASIESTPEPELVFGQSQMEADQEIDKVVWSLEHAQRLGDVRSVAELSDRLQKLWGVNGAAKKSPEPRQWGDAADDPRQGWNSPDEPENTPASVASTGWDGVPDIKPISTKPSDLKPNAKLLAEAEEARRSALGDSTEKLPLRKRVKGKLGLGPNSFKPTKGDSSPSQPVSAPVAAEPQLQPAPAPRVTDQPTPAGSAEVAGLVAEQPESRKEVENRGRNAFIALQAEVEQLVESDLEELKNLMVLSESDKQEGKTMSGFELRAAEITRNLSQMSSDMRLGLRKGINDLEEWILERLSDYETEKSLAPNQAAAE